MIKKCRGSAAVLFLFSCMSVVFVEQVALAASNDGAVSIGYRTTMPIPGQTSGKLSWVQVDLETTVKDLNFPRQLGCRNEILKSLVAAEESTLTEIQAQSLAIGQIQTIESQVKVLELSLAGIEPENQVVISNRIRDLKVQIKELKKNQDKNFNSILEAIRYLQKLTQGDWNRLFETVYALRDDDQEVQNIAVSFQNRFQLSKKDIEYFRSKFTESCTNDEGVRPSNVSYRPRFLPIEVKIRIPTQGMSPAQIREVRADIIGGSLGGAFSGRAAGYWTKGTEMMDGLSHGIHVAGIEWAPEVNAPTQTELVFKIKASADFGYLWRGTMGDSYLKMMEPIVRGQAIEVINQNNVKGIPLKDAKDDKAVLGVPPGMTSTDAYGFSHGTIVALKTGISAKIRKALEFSLAYAFSYYDTMEGSDNFEGNFSVLEQTIDASVFYDITQRISAGFYTRYDHREMQAEHFVRDTQLSIPSQTDVWAQIGGVIRVKW